VFATAVWASEKMKHVEDSAMQAATITTGRPPSRHCTHTGRRPTTQKTSPRKSEAKALRQKLVVHGPVPTRRAMSAPLLQQTAAPATSNAPRRAAGVAGARRVDDASGVAGIGCALDRFHAPG
jgi:hypothetical protein